VQYSAVFLFLIPRLRDVMIRVGLGVQFYTASRKKKSILVEKVSLIQRQVLRFVITTHKSNHNVPAILSLYSLGTELLM